MSEQTSPAGPTAIANVLPQAMTGLAGGELAIMQDAERRLALWDAKRKLVLTILNSTDVARFGNRLAKNKYASEKLLSVFGGRLELLKDPEGRPVLEKTMIDDDPDMGRIIIFTTYSRYTRPDGVVFEAAGSFSSKDDFFALDHGSYRPFADINLADILSAAFTESQKKAIFRGCGLGDFDDAEQTKVLAETAAGHDFAGSAPKGAAAAGDPVIGFGSQKGKKVSELTEAKDIAWYHKVYTENLNDPSKAKFAKQNRAIVDALAARMGKKPSAQGAAAPDPGVEDARQPSDGTAETDDVEDLAKLSRGTLIGRAFKLIETHAGKTGKGQTALIRALAPAIGIVPVQRPDGSYEDLPGALTSLADPHLRAMLLLSDEQIEAAKPKKEDAKPAQEATPDNG